jgi:hypothetical protein
MKPAVHSLSQLGVAIGQLWDKAANSAGQLARRVLAGMGVQVRGVAHYRTIQLARLLTDWCWDDEL